jgi:predicted ATPase
VIITIENFGAIKYFQFDTEKDLYLIFGKNSVGKSYAISLVYLIIKNILDLMNSALKKYNISYLFKYECSSDLKELLKKADKRNDEEIDISNQIEKHLTLYFDDFFVKKLNNSLVNTFDEIINLQNNFTEDNLQIKLEWKYIYLDIDLTVILELEENQRIVIKKCFFNKQIILKKAKTCRNLKHTEREIILYYPNNKIEHFEKSYFALFEKITLDSFGDLLMINDVYYLPASRSGLYQALSAFGQIFAQLANNRSFISKSVQLPAISEPVADYFLNLSNISSERENYGFIDYAKEIEKNILQGVVEFDDKSKKLFFMPDDTSLKLDLSATSSMVSEISPIVSYIKYIFSAHWKAKKEQKTLVFIEEPEAHLHPETQVKLMEVFARLVKDNKIKLVITSHSNYIFNKASNLVIDNKIDKEKFAAVLFEPTPEGSVAKILETDEYGIEDENFIDTAESIYQEKLDLINKLNG